jgi:hypothetical protein
MFRPLMGHYERISIASRMLHIYSLHVSKIIDVKYKILLETFDIES